MPTPVAVLSGGTRGFELGIFKNGSVAQGFNFPLSSNYRWWNGVDVLATQYLIYTDKYTMGSSNLADTIPVAWSTPDLTDQSLINLINTLPPRVGLPSFTSLQPALDWLQGTGDFYLVKNGLENIVTTNLQLYYDAGLYNSYVGTGTSVIDLSGNNRTGTLTNGPTFNSSGVGSFVFDGADDYISVPNFMGNTSTFSVSHWIYLNDTQSVRTIFSNYSTSGNGWVTGIRDDISNVFKFYLGSSHLYSNTTLLNNTWYHVAVTYNNGNPKIYINGVLDASSSDTIVFGSSWFGNDIGRLGNGSQYFNGKIAALQVYTTALTADQVLQNYNAQKGRFGLPTPSTNGLVAQLEAANPSSYPGSGTIWYDISGNGNNFTLFNGASYDSTTKSMVFDGSDDYARSTNFINLSSASATTVQWIGKQDTAASSQFLWEHTPDWNSVPGGFGIILDSTGSGFQQGSWHANWYNVAARNFLNSTQSSYQFFLQTHRLIPNNALGLQDWVNTDLQTFVVGPGYPTGTSTVGNNNGFANNYTYLASRAGSSSLLDGNIGVFLMYNRALTQPEIVQNYEYYRSLYGLSGVTKANLLLSLDAGNAQSYNGVGTTWYDVSGSVFDATLLNGPTYTTNGGGAIDFDGTDDSGTLPNISNLLTGSMTAECWFRIDGAATDWVRLVGVGGNSGNRTFGLWYNWNLDYFLWQRYGPTVDVLYEYTAMTTNVWYHLVGLTNGSSNKLFLNGVEIGSATNGGPWASSNELLSIAYAGFHTYHNGLIGSVRLYNRGLSDAEVLQNFNAQKNRYGL
jgi:hypothetical protein